ncbi:unnamed protein product, partial [Discosporangium mesarthrocarpum]
GEGGDGRAPRPSPLSEIVGVNTGGPQGRREGEPSHDPATYRLFVDLVERMLDQRPETRIKPTEALQHPFLADPPLHHTQTHHLHKEKGCGPGGGQPGPAPPDSGLG